MSAVDDRVGPAAGGDPRLIGGEMLSWSDVRHPGERAPAYGDVLAQLLGAVVSAGERVLIAGPHDTRLLDALHARHVRVTYLVRSLPDATAAAARGVEVLCGTLPKLGVEERYDAVVALDGLHRLCSVEGPQYDWAESLHALRRTLRPGGALLLGVENELGVHRLVDRGAPTSAHGDGAWHPVAEFDATRPTTASRLTEYLEAGGLRAGQVYAAWPVPEAPTVLAAPPALTGVDRPGGALATVVSTACAAAFAGRPVLSDPRRLAATAVRGGLGMEFAPAWVVLAHRAPRAAAPPPLPQVLVGDPVAGRGAGLVQEIVGDGHGGWTRRGVRPAALPADDARPAGPAAGIRPVPPAADGVHPAARAVGVRRDLAALDGPVPPGRPLEEILIADALRHDLPALRRRLTAYTAWLAVGMQQDDPLAGRYVFATVDNVLADGDRFHLLDPSWSATATVDVPVVACRALHRFAATVAGGGYAHPWPAAAGTGALTLMLAAAAGLRLDEDVLARARELEADIMVATGGWPPGERRALVERLREPGPGAPPIGPDSWREHEEASRRLREQLAHADAKLAWYEQELAARETELRRAHLLMAAFSGSPGYRLARGGVAVARRVKRIARRAVKGG